MFWSLVVTKTPFYPSQIIEGTFYAPLGMLFALERDITFLADTVNKVTVTV
jgi:hypothetical protein